MPWCDTTTTSCPGENLLSQQDMLTREMRCVKQAMRRAGRAIAETARHYSRNPMRGVQRTVVTEADIEAHHILRDHLQTTFPEDGWLSEENCHDLDRFQCRRVWVVDPLDGTRDLVRGHPEYAISVALIENGRPILGVIYNPCTHELFEAVAHGPAQLNGIPVHCTPTSLYDPQILVSRIGLEQGRYARYRHQAQFKPCGSMAYRLACVAAGRAQATLSVTPKNEWDIAAGVLLITRAGGRVTDLQGQAHRFNRPRTLVNGLIAAAPGSFTQVLGLVNAQGS